MRDIEWNRRKDEPYTIPQTQATIAVIRWRYAGEQGDGRKIPQGVFPGKRG
jgi:hypothetical protein